MNCSMELERPGGKPGLIGGLMGAKPAPPRGVYLWGGVGRGKSMLMDLFHSTLSIPEKRRAHFHAFMLEVHALLRIERAKEAGDPIPPVAAKLAVTDGGAGLRVLAFDEMVVNNSADAMIMSRLFRALIVDRGRHHRHHFQPRALPSSTRTASTASISCRSSR